MSPRPSTPCGKEHELGDCKSRDKYNIKRSAAAHSLLLEGYTLKFTVFDDGGQARGDRPHSIHIVVLECIRKPVVQNHYCKYHRGNQDGFGKWSTSAARKHRAMADFADLSKGLLHTLEECHWCHKGQMTPQGQLAPQGAVDATRADQRKLLALGATLPQGLM